IGPREGDASAVRSLRRWQTQLGDLNDRAQLIAFVAARPQATGRPLVRRLEALRRASLAALRRRPVAFEDPRPPSPPAPRAGRDRAAATGPSRAAGPPRSRAARVAARPPRSPVVRPAAAR